METNKSKWVEEGPKWSWKPVKAHCSSPRRKNSPLPPVSRTLRRRQSPACCPLPPAFAVCAILSSPRHELLSLSICHLRPEFGNSLSSTTDTQSRPSPT